MNLSHLNTGHIGSSKNKVLPLCIYVCLKLVKKLTEIQNFHLKMFIAINQKGK